MTEYEKLKVKLNLFKLQLKELRETPENMRPANYEDQLYRIAKYIKKLEKELQAIN